MSEQKKSKIDSELKDLGEVIELSLHSHILKSVVNNQELTLEIKPDSLINVMRVLVEDANCQFTQLLDICTVDYLGRDKRFDVVYHLLSINLNQRIRVKLRIDEGEYVKSLTSLFASAGWYERECWDMYGVLFVGNPDMRRILTDYNFEGHPGRKDFPLSGYFEVRYDEYEKRVIKEPVKLTQQYRSFDYESPWAGDISQESYLAGVAKSNEIDDANLEGEVSKDE